MAESQDLNAKRAAARKAMGGEAYEAKLVTQTETLIKKRREAMMAMEKPEQRQKREAQEKYILEREVTKRKLAEDLINEKENLAKRKASEALAQQTREEERRNLEKTRQAEFESKQNIIERLRQDNNQKLAPLRTLKTDLARSVKTENLSATKISLMEKDRELKTDPFVARPNQAPRRFNGLIFSALIICVLSLGAIGFIIYKNQNPNSNSSSLIINPLIFADENQALAIENKSALEIINTISQLRKLASAEDSLLNIYPTKILSSDSKNPSIVTVGLAEFLSASKINLTEEINRHFDNKFMIGIYRGTDQNLFWVFSINDWEYSKSTILSQETSFLDSLLGPFLLDTTFSIDLTQAQIIDEVVKNKDARAVKNRLNQTIAIYSFLDQKTLVVTQNEASLSRLINNFNTPRPGQ